MIDSNPQTAVLKQNGTSNDSLPFQRSQVLPAGSLLTVRLKLSITAESAGSSTIFAATIDEPVVLDGDTLIPRGAIASGRAGPASVSTVRPDRGYVRLALESVKLDGLDLPLQTATLFARQISGNLSSRTIRLEKGRRLTFRLTEPFYPGVQHTAAGH